MNRQWLKIRYAKAIVVSGLINDNFGARIPIRIAGYRLIIDHSAVISSA